MSDFENSIREIVRQELASAQQQNTLVPVAQFCEDHNVSRTTIWRAEKQGRLKLSRIGKKVFVNSNSIV